MIMRLFKRTIAKTTTTIKTTKITSTVEMAVAHEPATGTGPSPPQRTIRRGKPTQLALRSDSRT